MIVRRHWVLVCALWFLADPAFATDPAPIPGESGTPGQVQNTAPPASLGSPTLSPPEGISEAQIAAETQNAHASYVQKYGLWFLEPESVELCPVHVYADGGFLMVHSYIANNPAFVTHGPALSTIPSDHFNYDVNFAPRVTLGAILDNGYGIRGTWWQLDDAVSTFTFPSKDASLHTTISSVPVPGLPGFTSPGAVADNTGIFKDMLHFDNHLHLTVADLEVFREFTGENWSAMLGGGARYLYLSQAYAGFRVNKGKLTTKAVTLNLLQDSDYVSTGRNFSGAGLTDFLEVRRGIVRGFSWYASARGSVLFGETGTDSFQQTDEELKTTAKGKTSTFVTADRFQSSTPGHKTLAMGDFETGMDLSIVWGRAVLFMRAGLTDQTLFGSGSATSDHGNISFFGLRFSAGVNY